MFRSPSKASAETPPIGEHRGVLNGSRQPTSYGSSHQSTVTFATLGTELHSDDSTSPRGSGGEQRTAGVEANGKGEPGKVEGSKDFEDSLTGQILALALPALLSLSMDPLMSAVDTMYVGRLDPELGGGVAGLGALGINTNVFLVTFLMFAFLATVPTPFVASARARGDEVEASRLIGQLLTSALIMGSALMIVLETTGPAIIRLMGGTPYNEVEALSYLRARATSAPAALVISVGNGAFRGFLDTMTPLLILLGATALNFILDPILIFAAGLGVRGAAIATAAAEWSAALTFLFLLSRKEPAITPRRPSLPDSAEGWTEVRKLVTSSVAVFTRTLALQVVIVVATASAARIGSVSIAADQVACQVWMVLGFMADSIAVAGQGLVADRIGAGSIVQARSVARKVLGAGVVVRCAGFDEIHARAIVCIVSNGILDNVADCALAGMPRDFIRDADPSSCLRHYVERYSIGLTLNPSRAGANSSQGVGSGMTTNTQLSNHLRNKEDHKVVLTIGVWSGLAAMAVVGLLGRNLSAIFTSDKEVLSTVAPVIGVVAILQPINGYVFGGDGILQGSQDFVYEALTMLLSSSIGTAYILFCMSSGPGSDTYTLFNVWIGVAVLMCSRAATFTFRHFLDPRGPLAVGKGIVCEGGTGDTRRQLATCEDAS